MSSDTTNWNRHRNIKESIRSLERKNLNLQEGFSIQKIKERIKKINEKNKGFTKLPTLENIYEQEAFTTKHTNVRFSEGFKERMENEKPTYSDFADKEFAKEMEKLGFAKESKLSMESGDEKLHDKRCDDVNKKELYEGEFVRKKGDSFLWKIIKSNKKEKTFDIQRDTAENDIETITNVPEKELYRGDFVNVNLLEIIPNVNYLPFVLFDYGVKKMGIGVCDRITESHNTVVERKRYAPVAPEKDKRTVVAEIYNAIFLCIVIFMTYNWFFIWCFKDKDENFIPTIPVVDDNLGESSSNQAYKFILEYYLFPLKYFDKFFTCQDPDCFSIPVMLNKVTSNPSLQWIFIFILLISGFSSDITMFNSIPYMKEYILQGNSSWLKDWLLGLSQGKDYSFGLIALVFVGIISSMMSESEPEVKVPGQNVVVQTAESWGKLLKRLIIFIIQLLITAFLYPYVCIYLFYYLISYSIFGMSKYPKFGLASLFANLGKVNEYISSFSGDAKTCRNVDGCKTWIEKMQEYIPTAVTIAKIMIYSIPFLAINSYYNVVSLSSEVLKWGLILLTIIFMPLIYIAILKIIDFLKNMSGFGDLFTNNEDDVDEYEMYEDGINCELEDEGMNILSRMKELENMLKPLSKK